MSERRPDPCGGLQPSLRLRARRSGSARSAFTLVELLVVIGIIAILISLVLASLSAARRQANLVKCGANLRQLGQALSLHAHDHRGYLPLAGLLQLDDDAWSADTLPKGVNDLEWKKYSYASAGQYGIRRVLTPLPVALAPYLGVKGLDFNDWQKLDQQLNDPHGVWQYFMCPSTNPFDRARSSSDPNDTTPEGQVAMVVASIGPIMAFWWSTNSDFAMNEVVFGFDYRAEYNARRLRGNLARVRNPAELLLFSDAAPPPQVDPTFPRSFPCPWAMFTPVLDPPSNASNPVTLADVLANNNNMMPYRAQIDLKRHKGRMNVLFADGHVDALPTTASELQRVSLTPRQ